MIGVGIVGAMLTVAAVAAGVMMMTGSGSAPVTTQVAAISAPPAIAQAPAVAPVMVSPPVAPPQAVAPAINTAPLTTFYPALPPSPVAPPAPVQPAPPLKAPGQCEIGQQQQLALDVSATKRMEVGNVIRIFSGSYVSQPILVTRDVQTVTFPAPPGSNGVAEIMVEQKTTGGWTFEDEANGIATEVERSIDAHHDLLLLRWAMPRC